MGTEEITPPMRAVVKSAAMVTHPSFAFMRTFMPIITMALLASSLCGCAAVSTHLNGMYNAVLTHCQVKHDLAEIRQDAREALVLEEIKARRLAAEREVEQARLQAERARLEMQFCQANQEAAQQKIKNNIREKMASKVAFNVEHGLEVGELQVDVEELQALLKKREQENAQKPPQAPAERGKKPCSCCDRPCGCEPGLIRRLCPHCRNKPCEAEKTCGGPEALNRLEQEAANKPLRPAEIPLKLPVRLSFGMQQPEMEAGRIIKVPNLPAEQFPGMRPCTQPCNDPNGCPPCTQRLPSLTPPVAPDSPPAPMPPEEPAVGKKPDIDEEARRVRPRTLPVRRVSATPISVQSVWTDLVGQPKRTTNNAGAKK